MARWEAIHSCLADHGSQALVGSTLYTSGEPCAMCMGAILWCHIGRLVSGATVQQLSTKIEQIMISSADLAARESFDPISSGGDATFQITAPQHNHRQSTKRNRSPL